MMRKDMGWKACVVALGLLALTPWMPATSGQTSAERAAEVRHLEDRLRNLQRTESTLGTKHPSRDFVIAEILEVRRRIARVTEPSTADAKSEERGGSISSTSAQELREMLERMAERIEQLESRVAALEGR